MKKSNLKPIIVLSAICLIVALILALINSVTSPIIKEAQAKAEKAALQKVLPDAEAFEDLIIDERYPSSVKKGYKADCGFVFRATVTGKSSGLIIMIGIDSYGKVVGTEVISDKETDSYSANVFPLVSGTDSVYSGMTAESFEPFLVSGATLTSKAYGEAVRAALQAFEVAQAELKFDEIGG